MDLTLLSRLQFAFTVTFHIIFPAFTIGTSAFIATLLGRYLWTRDENLRLLARFWTKIFAVSFAMGVVSGLVLSYEFGTNWGRFSLVAGNVVGPLIGYEVLTAFFLESTFLGIMLFGSGKVPPFAHFLAACAVAAGTVISAFWILSANSWMQFPAGAEIRNGVVYPTDWLAVIFNPTFPMRFLHMVIGAYLTTAFVVMSVGARFALTGRYAEHSGVMLRMGLGLAVILAPLQLIIGDIHGLVTEHYQPEKIAAIEAHWESGPAALELFAWPNMAQAKDDFSIAIPHLASLLLTHEWNGAVPALDDYPAADRPPVPEVFFAFRIMAGIGFLMIAVAVWGAVLWYRKRLLESRPFLIAAKWAWPGGFIAIIMGWIVAEMGRQPWSVTGILRTADSASPVLAAQVLVSLGLFVVVYGIVFSTGIFYINRMINLGPSPELTAEETGVPTRPLSGAERAARSIRSLPAEHRP